MRGDGTEITRGLESNVVPPIAFDSYITQFGEHLTSQPRVVSHGMC